MSYRDAIAACEQNLRTEGLDKDMPLTSIDHVSQAMLHLITAIKDDMHDLKTRIADLESALRSMEGVRH